MAKSSKTPEHSLISAERLRHLHKVSAQLSVAQSPHPAALAGCFSHLRSGDAVWPASYEPAAQIASGLKHSPAAPLTTATSRGESHLDLLAELAKNLRAENASAVLVAFLRERELLAAEAVAAGRRIARRQLPLVLLSFGRTLPQPGDPQKRIGIPEIAVAADDVIAAYRVAEEAFWRARTGVGPTWIRCVTGTRP